MNRNKHGISIDVLVLSQFLGSILVWGKYELGGSLDAISYRVKEKF